MRDLESSDKNVLTVNDARSDTQMELYYRTPTSREEALYQAALVKKRGRKVVIKTHATRLKYGLRIITGFKEGDFGLGGKPVSADPKSENYREDWKECLTRGASDIIALLAQTVFEATGVDVDLATDEDLEEEELGGEEEEVEDTIPLEKS